MVASMGGDIGILIVVYVGSWRPAGTLMGLGGRAIRPPGKGRSEGAGFALGFCLGLLGLLIAAESPTPEYEAMKLQRQMQLMGIPLPSGQPGAPVPPAGAMPWQLAAGMLPQRRQEDRLKIASIITVVVAALYAGLKWVVFDSDSYYNAQG